MFIENLQAARRVTSSALLAVILQGKLSRLGKEARAAGRSPADPARRPASPPLASEAESEPESESDEHEDDKAFEEEAQGILGRRTRQASAHRASAWQDMEATPPKHKPRRKARCTPTEFNL